uniref:Uncharacterized protein n=1 Tax=Caulobacter phage BL57 TaxID=3348355 RepID=A0AB74UMT9_9VIRU
MTRRRTKFDEFWKVVGLLGYHYRDRALLVRSDRRPGSWFFTLDGYSACVLDHGRHVEIAGPRFPVTLYPSAMVNRLLFVETPSFLQVEMMDERLRVLKYRVIPPEVIRFDA